VRWIGGRREKAGAEGLRVFFLNNVGECREIRIAGARIDKRHTFLRGMQCSRVEQVRRRKRRKTEENTKAWRDRDVPLGGKKSDERREERGEEIFDIVGLEHETVNDSRRGRGGGGSRALLVEGKDEMWKKGDGGECRNE